MQENIPENKVSVFFVDQDGEWIYNRENLNPRPEITFLPLPRDRSDLDNWLDDEAATETVVSEQALGIALNILTNGWRQRANDRNEPAPVDNSNSCKFATILVKTIFGGTIEGNYDHQYNVIDGVIIDLNKDCDDVITLKEKKQNPYRHDSIFFQSEDHLDSMLSCIPRIATWLSTVALSEHQNLDKEVQSKKNRPRI